MTKLLFAATCLVCTSFATNLVAQSQDSSSPFPKLSLKADDQILFLGDSITQAGQYIAFVQTWLWANHPDLKLDIVNLGLGSETASGDSEPDHPFPRPCVHERIDRILAKTDPDVVFVCYGMNDGIYYPPGEERFAHYREGIDSLLAKLEKEGRKIVLMTPPPFDKEAMKGKGKLVKEIDPDFDYSWMTPYANYDEVLKGYATWILEEKKDEVVPTVSLHKAMTEWLSAKREVNPEYKMADGIHPPVEGHLVMALEILESLGVDRASAEIQLTELTGIHIGPKASNTKATPLWDLITKRRRLLNSSWIEDVGHKKPKSKKLPMPLDEAKAKAAEMETAIRTLLNE